MDLELDISKLVALHGKEMGELHARLILAEAKVEALTKKVIELQAALPYEYHNVGHPSQTEDEIK